MTSKCYTDSEGNYICSDDVIFIENEEDIIDIFYIKDVWYQETQQLYKEILNEWKLIHTYRTKEDNK